MLEQNLPLTAAAAAGSDARKLAPASVSASASAAAAPRKRKRRGKWYLLLALLVLIGVGVGFYLHGKQEKPVSVTVERATKKTIIQLVSATGKVQPEVEVKISPEVAGEIIELPVQDGQPVKKGDLLLRIKPDNYQAQVAQQEATISSAKAMSLQNKAQMLKAEQDLRRNKDLFERHVIGDSDMLAAQTIAETTKATFEASVFEIQRAESALSQSRDLLAKTTIFSPMDGTISQLNNKLGERVVATGQFAGTDVMHIADLRSMEVRVNVNENDVVNVKIGDTANITVDAYPGRIFHGKVYQIANTAVTTAANTQEEVTNFEVRIRFEQTEGARLRPGMSATADVETATVRDAVAVPIQAVTIRTPGDKLSPEEREKLKAKAAAQAGGEDAELEFSKTKQAADEKLTRAKQRRVVFIKDGGIVHQRVVETGIADNADIEIKSGVQPGEEVVSGPYRAISRLLKEGARVMLEKAVP